jgi:type IV pilus assembly protein PilO
MSRLESLQEKPWYLQLAMFGGVAILLYVAFWYFVTSGTRTETAEIETKVESLQQANAKAQIAAQRLNEFKALYQSTQANYEDLKALLPEQRELTMVLQGIQDRARGRLSMRSFKPKEDVQQDFYSGKPIDVEVSGTYNNVGQFFAQMASYQRIVSITDFKVTKLASEKGPGEARSNQTVSAEFLVTAYYVSPEKLQAPPPEPEEKKGKGKKDKKDKKDKDAKAESAE